MRTMTVNEWLLLLSMAMLLPVIIGLLTAAFFGVFRRSEDVKYEVLRDPEPDYWDTGSRSQEERRDEPW